MMAMWLNNQPDHSWLLTVTCSPEHSDCLSAAFPSAPRWNSDGFGFLLSQLGVSQVTRKTSVAVQGGWPQRKTSRAGFGELQDSLTGALRANGSVVSDNNIQKTIKCSLCVRRAASICAVIISPSLRSSGGGAGTAHSRGGPGGATDPALVFHYGCCYFSQWLKYDFVQQYFAVLPEAMAQQGARNMLRQPQHTRSAEAGNPRQLLP